MGAAPPTLDAGLVESSADSRLCPPGQLTELAQGPASGILLGHEPAQLLALLGGLPDASSAYELGQHRERWTTRVDHGPTNWAGS